MKSCRIYFIMAFVLASSAMGQFNQTNDTAPLSLERTSWEVCYPYQPQKGLFLFKFNSSQFRMTSQTEDYSFGDFSSWYSKDNWFDVIEISHKDLRFEGRHLSGSFDQENIHGLDRKDNHVLSWKGYRVDRDKYEFILSSERTVVIVKMLGYVLNWPNPEKYSIETLPIDKKTERDIHGLVFEVQSPESLKGKLITSHHDGFLASGYATRIAEKDKLYIQRVGKEFIGDTSFSICSIYLDLEETNCRTLKEVALELEKQILSSDDDLKYQAIRKLGNFNTNESRNVLIKTYWNSKQEIKFKAAYMLTQFPHDDAAKVYMDILDGNDNWMKWHAIEALHKIKYVKSEPKILFLKDNTNHWFIYYACQKALRTFQSKELPDDLQNAIEELFSAKSCKNVPVTLESSYKLLEQHFELVAPDFLDIYFWPPDYYDFEPKHALSSRTLLTVVLVTEDDNFLLSHVERFFEDEDVHIRYKCLQLLKVFYTEDKLKDKVRSLWHTDPDLYRYSKYSSPMR